VYAKHGIKVKTHNENMTNSTARSLAPETIFRHYQPTGCDQESMKTYSAPFTVLSFKKRLNWKINFVTGPNSVNGMISWHHTAKKFSSTVTPILKSQCILFKDRKVIFVAWTLSSYNLPTDRARELFEPSKEAEGLLGLI